MKKKKRFEREGSLDGTERKKGLKGGWLDENENGRIKKIVFLDKDDRIATLTIAERVIYVGFAVKSKHKRR